MSQSAPGVAAGAVGTKSTASSATNSPTAGVRGGGLDEEPYVQVSVKPETATTASAAPVAHAPASLVHPHPRGVGVANWSKPTAAALAAGAQANAKAALKAAATPFSIKAQLAQMLKGGVIMDVTNAEEARIAEEAGACAVMALERVPSDIRRDGGVARMSHPAMIKAIQAAVSIPVMAKVRVGHFVEAQIIQALEVDFIDESEVLTPADDQHHIIKSAFATPFVCGCRNLGEALRRVQEGAAMIRTKGEAGTGNVVEAVRHARQVAEQVRRVIAMKDPLELASYAREIGVEVSSLQSVQTCGRLPVVQFAAGGIATPADAALMMQLGMDGVFVGSGIFGSSDPAAMASAMVRAVTHYQDPHMLAQICSETTSTPMRGLEIDPAKMVLFATREQP